MKAPRTPERSRRWLTVPMLVVAALLVGPAPGEVGSCGEGSDTADSEAFCFESGFWRCARDWALRGQPPRPDTVEEECRQNVQNSCPGTQWSIGCAPTQRQTDACIAALMDPTRLATPANELTECRTDNLCAEPGE